MSVNRYAEPGWHRIGRIDKPRRRSLWIRESPNCIELCAGREGDDGYVRITPDNPQWRDLENVLSRARFAAEHEDRDGLTLEREDDARCNAELYLDACALGYAAVVQAGDRRLVTAAQFDDWACTKAALHDAGVRLAAALGNLAAAERAELTALRRLREGVLALRGEMATGEADGAPIAGPREHAVETIDALLRFAAPVAPVAKEPA